MEGWCLGSSRLILSDVVTLNDSFIETFKAGRYKAYGSDLNLESAGVIKDVMNGFSSVDIGLLALSHNCK